jgi:carboxymethylenebutenolidase
MSEDDKKGLAEGLRALGRPATFHTYPGTGHWFMETDRPDAYNAEAAKLAWERTVVFLTEQLGE